MNITNIIFLVESPLSKRDYERFGIDLLKGNGFTVEVWDFTPALLPEFIAKYNSANTVVADLVKKFFNKADVKQAISKLGQNVICVNLIGYNLDSLFIYRALAKKNIKYAVYTASTLPPNTYFEKGYKKILLRLTAFGKKYTFKRFFAMLFLRLPHKLLGIKTPDILLAGGKCSGKHRLIDSSTEIIWAHALDFDLYMQAVNKNGSTINEPMAVFLDEYIPFHSDYIRLKIDPPDTAESYYPALCNYFSALEKTYGVKVVVAAHPRANCDKYKEYFAGREIVQYATVDLVKNAQLVIAHFSASINYGVLFQKPIAFITTNNLEKSYASSWIKTVAHLLGKNPINVNEKLIEGNEFAIDTKKYADYKNNFIKVAGTPEVPFWQLFADKVRQFNI